MNQITTTRQKIVGEQQQKSKKDIREGKGRILAVSRRVYRLQNSDNFYVESEKNNDLYYFVRYNFSGFKWCSCPDNSTRRGITCKHQFAIEYAIRLGTLKDIEKLPTETKRYNSSSTIVQQQSKSYKDDDYDF